MNLNLARISKAIAAAVSGAGIGAGSVVYAYIQIPAALAAQLPPWVSTDVPIANAVIGFIVAGVIVYFAPANAPPKPS